MFAGKPAPTGLISCIAALLLFLLISANVSAEVTADRIAQYTAAPVHKALAVSTDNRAVGSVAGLASEATAAVTAFQACEAQRQTLGVEATCEVVRINGDAVATGASIKQRVPAGRHPLFMWRYDSSVSRVYLVGSMHVMKPSIHPLPEPIERAFAASDRIAVEVNSMAVSPQQMQALLRAHALLPPGQTLSASLPAATLRALETHLSSQGVALDALAQLKPALVATQLAVARLTALGYFAQFGLDQYFIGKAGARPILELERVEDQMALLASPSMAVQIDMLDITLEQMDEIEGIVADMVVAWLAGDDAALRTLFEEQSPQTPAYEAFNKRLLDDRNLGMADKVQGYLTAPGAYFVLVGAAHLAGQDSVVDVLNKRGVKGTRIYSNDSL